jgi:hypothetical protein
VGWQFRRPTSFHGHAEAKHCSDLHKSEIAGNKVVDFFRFCNCRLLAICGGFVAILQESYLDAKQNELL